MKFSYRQILASAAGAVLSAVIASVFGVKGTIVGVAIGSIAATTGTALVFQSIERTNKAVKQVVVRAPETSLLRRLGGTEVAGITASTSGDSRAPAEESTTSAAVAPDETIAAGAGEPALIPGVTREPEQPEASEQPEEQPEAPEPLDGARGPGGLRWPVVVLAVVGVFLFSLLFVTVVELIAGRPLADLFGHSGGGTTVERIFESPSTTLPAPTTTTTSTTTSSTTTSTSSTVPTTSTTTIGGSTSTTTTGAGTTSTTSPTSGTTTTTTTTTASGTTSP